MNFQRSGREIDATRFDGSERAARDIGSMRGAAVTLRGEIEVATSFGRQVCRQGQWVARDVATGTLRVFDHGEFQLCHEARP